MFLFLLLYIALGILCNIAIWFVFIKNVPTMEDIEEEMTDCEIMEHDPNLRQASKEDSKQLDEIRRLRKVADDAEATLPPKLITIFLIIVLWPIVLIVSIRSWIIGKRMAAKIIKELNYDE
jgi:hypothetical protein